MGFPAKLSTLQPFQICNNHWILPGKVEFQKFPLDVGVGRVYSTTTYPTLTKAFKNSPNCGERGERERERSIPQLFILHLEMKDLH